MEERARNHYLFHLCLSGTGKLIADNGKGTDVTYQVKSGQGFLLFPGQVCTYIANGKGHTAPSRTGTVPGQ